LISRDRINVLMESVANAKCAWVKLLSVLLCCSRADPIHYQVSSACPCSCLPSSSSSRWHVIFESVVFLALNVNCPLFQRVVQCTTHLNARTRELRFAPKCIPLAKHASSLEPNKCPLKNSPCQQNSRVTFCCCRVGCSGGSIAFIMCSPSGKAASPTKYGQMPSLTPSSVYRRTLTVRMSPSLMSFDCADETAKTNQHPPACVGDAGLFSHLLLHT
jgi:hypothetical protein